MKKSVLLIILLLLITQLSAVELVKGQKYASQAYEYYSAGLYDRAAYYFQNAIKIDSLNSEYYKYLARSYFALTNYEDAAKAFMLQAEYASYSEAQKAVELANVLYTENMYFIKSVRNLGSAINSPASDFAPVISPDNKRLYFTSKRGIKGDDNIWIAEKYADEWLQAKDIGDMLNTEKNESISAISSNYNIAFITGYYDNQPFPDVYSFNIKNKDLFGSSKKLPSATINSKYFDGQVCISSDGLALLFVSDRPDGFGKTDIYVSTRLSVKGIWSPPINLGEQINTSAEELSPWLSPDGKNLFFASKGHSTFGGYDLFVAEKLSNNWTKWSKPVNLGKEVNSVKDDYFLSIPFNDTTVAYFASNRYGGYGGDDIYIVKARMPKTKAVITPVKIREQVIISGQVLSADKKEPIPDAEIQWEYIVLDTITQKPTIATVEMKSDSVGHYSLVGPSPGNFIYNAKKEGFLYTKGTITVKNDTIFDILMERIEVGKAVIVDSVFFDFDKSNLRDDEPTKKAIDFIYQTLKANPRAVVEISGHTDWIGTNEYNMGLSQRRAQAVVDRLIELGIPKDNLIAKGYGEEKPIATNETPEGRQKNRRTEMKIIKINSK